MDINVGVASTPAIVDINGDDLMDLVVGERTGNNDSEGKCGNMNYYQNQGNLGAPDFDSDVMAFPNTGCFGSVIFNSQTALREYSSPVFFMGETGLEMITGSEQGKLRHYTGIRDGIYDAFTLANADMGEIRDGFRSSPAIADVNGDGMYDVMIGNARGGLTYYGTDLALTVSTNEEQNPVSELVLYPNPVSQQLVLHYPGNLSTPGLARIYDATGVLVKQLELTGNTTFVDVRALTPGLYVVEFRVSDVFGQAKFLKF